MARRLFKEVFQDINLGEVDDYFDDVYVTGVTMWKNARKLCVEIESSHLISKRNIWKAEDCIRLYSFGEYSRNKVEIIERYLLSGQYNTENLTHIYYDSFMDELRQSNYVDFKLLFRAPFEVQDNLITFTVVDGIMAQERKSQIEKFFRNVYLSRFGMNVTVKLKLVKKEKKEESEEDKADEAIEDVPVVVMEGSPEEKDDRMEVIQSKFEESYSLEDNAVVMEFPDLKKKEEEKKPKKDYKANLDKYKKMNYDDPDCFYGKNTEGDITPICEINDMSIGEHVVRGQVFSLEDRQLKSGKYIITGAITDFTDSIGFKLFVKEDDRNPILEDLKKGGFYRIKGIVDYDDWSREIAIKSINGINKIQDFRVKREDNAEVKRVELHLHTNFSEMDSVADTKKIVQQAYDFGHKAMAITDHGVAQAFPVANTYVHEKLGDPEDFKLIYGLEGYFVDDIKTLVMNSQGQSLESDYVVFDIETTGLSFKFSKIIEIGAVRLDSNGQEIDRFDEFINPEIPISYATTKLTSITDNDVKNADTIDKVLPRFLEFAKGAMLVAHNATFDTTFIRVNAHRCGLEYNFTALDTMTLAHIFLPDLGRYTLDRLCNYFKVKNQHHHRADADAEVTAKIFLELMKMINATDAKTVDDLNKLGAASPDAIRKAKSYHGIILCKNDTGRVNLYRLISESHIKYFNRRPRIPMSLIEKYREGLILGSACSSGELYSAIIDGAEDEEIERLVRYFDYLEIQPIGNNKYLIDDEKVEIVQNEEDLQNINRRIVELGERFDKPVVATGDVHFINPEDVIYRTIVVEGDRNKGNKKVDLEDDEKQPPLYFRTTEEMLDEFAYLGDEKAYEVVVTNTNKIADMIEKISPVRPDKAPPVIADSDKTLRDICYTKLHELYGPNPPQIAIDRLDKELDSIIGNGYSVMYIIAQKLVWKSVADGYLVGSRGSVGSSFAATMSGITEVNPLPPHYLCPHCYYTEFDSERVKKFSGMSGCDMPDAVCPKCGKPLLKEGHDIPFETFLGFKGDKEPDIDLNFSGEYQPRAHAYLEEIFGKEHAFRAGTIGTLAEKTAYGYVLKYCEARDIRKRRMELERLAMGCTGVKRTSGQHPGGIIVTPDNEDIYSFTPIQKPANDMTVDTVTTHFEYHSIQHNLLKFDILGHDDPTMIKRLEDLTGLKATEIPLDDKKVMSLFKGTEVLGIKPSDINGVPLGSLGIPEFGTDFAMQMLIDADPQSFSDLVRIAGLAHGTDVWLGNAQTLIQEGKCKLSSAICCRDDIMVYLIYQGLESGMAFNIMENVRKGKVAGGKCKNWDEWKEEMANHGVPDWYIWSCGKIKYMFPKAHAVAYVMMSWRVAYYKIYYPLAYYTAFYSIRATAFSYEIMCQGEKHLDTILNEYMKMDKNKMSAKEQDTYRDMRLVKEMYARGFKFMPIDIYRAKADRFQIIDGKIMPSFASIDGMGEKAAKQLEDAAKNGVFMSQEELKDRAKLSGTVIEKMAELGILGDMPATSQLTFDFL